MDTIAGNIANINTTETTAGQPSPYRRRFVVLAPGQSGDPSKPGVHVQQVGLDQSPFIRKFEPWHKDAGSDGYVNYPNVDLSIEYVNALEASRAYEANVTAMETTKAMINSSLRLIG
jgi:flagellar basal-body rod protein FlgC